jgi:hypothetical protein
MTEPSQPDTDSSTAHTPIPWRELAPGVIAGATDPGWGAIANVPHANTEPESAANADLIVRAVNNHAKLLAMLKRVLTTTLEIDKRLGHGHFNPGTLQKMADAIEEAQS